ncbi:hypothetical protein [Shouchella shacheensis]|uniref:hypothetical protein n=1 Tax=Shouchella shacheensis TaxID=1649580 RepID=UPI00074036EE|nr:hypothetical protein [Shouchella shacheensis]
MNTDHLSKSRKQSTVTKMVLGIAEAMLGFPVYGGAFILALFWSPLFVMLIFHIIGYRLAKKAKLPTTGHTLGIITSSLGWIPVIGMILHIITAFYLLFEAFMGRYAK